MAARYERGLFDPEAPRGRRPRSTTPSGRSPVTAACRRASPPRRPRWPATRSSATWSCCGTTTTSPSRATRRPPSPRTSLKRYEAYGWHVQRVEPAAERRPRPGTRLYDGARRPRRRRPTRPSFIAMRSIIAWPAPNAQNTEAAHGSALGDDEVAATKRVLGFDPEQTFEVADEVLAHTRAGARPRPSRPRAEWEKQLAGVAHRQPGARRRVRPDRRGRAARGLGGRSSRSSRRARASPPVPRPARCSRRSARSSPSCGAAPPTSPARTTPRSTRRRRSSRRATRCRRPTRTAARSTSASASTPWPRR